MRFSVIIPVYNSKQYIERCIKSILEQEYNDYEIIIIDDGSTDNGIEIINQILGKASIDWNVVSKINGGQGSARNIGIKCARGEYLVFIDSDDYIEPAMFKVINSVIETYNPEMVCFNSLLTDEKGMVLGKYNMCGQLKGETHILNHPEMLLFPPAIWNKIIRRDFFFKVGCFFDEGIIYEDTVVSRALMAESSKVFFLNDYLYYYVQHNQSTMGKSTENGLNSRIMDIVNANESLLLWFNEKNIFNRFYYEIESISVNTILFYALDIINMNNKADKRQDILVDFIKDNFSEFYANTYLSNSDKKRIEVLLNRQYSRYYWRYALIKKIKRIIKKKLDLIKKIT